MVKLWYVEVKKLIETDKRNVSFAIIINETQSNNDLIVLYIYILLCLS